MKTYSSLAQNETFQEVPCRLCDYDLSNSVPYLSSDNVTFVKCPSCGLIYQNPQPVFEDLKKRYGQSYFDYELENDRNFFNLMKLGLQDIAFFDKPADFFENNRFLDIGCATGLLVKFMKSRGWDARGVEICEQSARFGIEKRGIDIFIGSLEEAAFPDQTFSVVHLSHLIEHVPEPLNLLREIKRILTERGTAIITTPNIDGLQARIFGRHWRSAIADHLTLFSVKTIKRLFDRVGLKILRRVTWGGLAKGTAPGFIKRPVDYLAKKFGFGDVMLFQVSKSADLE